MLSYTIGFLLMKRNTTSLNLISLISSLSGNEYLITHLIIAIVSKLRFNTAQIIKLDSFDGHTNWLASVGFDGNSLPRRLLMYSDNAVPLHNGRLNNLADSFN